MDATAEVKFSLMVQCTKSCWDHPFDLFIGQHESQRIQEPRPRVLDSSVADIFWVFANEEQVYRHLDFTQLVAFEP